MNLIHTTKPTTQQKKAMEVLVKSCQEKELLSLSAPVEEEIECDMFLLYEEDNQLAAMLFLFFPEHTVCECCGFVDPNKRRRGFFSRLLEKALDLVEDYEEQTGCQVDFCFLVDKRTPSAMAVLKAINAEYWYSEYKMERRLTVKDKHKDTKTSLTIQNMGEHLYAAFLEGQVIGTCAVLVSGDQIYLYAFQIHEAFRGQGYGEKFLLEMLSVLTDMGNLVTIQVSGQNYIARNLYKKTGFRITESLSYYLY